MIFPGEPGVQLVTADRSGLHISTCTPDGAFTLLIGGTDYYSQEVSLTYEEARVLRQALTDWLGSRVRDAG